MRTSRWAAGVLASCAVTAAFAAAPNAVAARPSQQHHSSHAAIARGAWDRATPKTGGRNLLLAGYYSYENAGLASASTTITIPTVKCPTGATMDLGFGVYGIVSGAQDLGASNQADVQTDCGSGTPSYYISAYTSGGGNNFTAVSAGDVVIASLYENGTTTTATVHDVTAGITEISSGSSAFDGQEMTGAYNYFHPGTIPSFKTATMTRSQVNGDYLAYAPGLVAQKMQPATQVQISPSVLNAAGDGFTLTFKHASS